MDAHVDRDPGNRDAQDSTRDSTVLGNVFVSTASKQMWPRNMQNIPPSNSTSQPEASSDLNISRRSPAIGLNPYDRLESTIPAADGNPVGYIQLNRHCDSPDHGQETAGMSNFNPQHTHATQIPLLKVLLQQLVQMVERIAYQYRVPTRYILEFLEQNIHYTFQDLGFHFKHPGDLDEVWNLVRRASDVSQLVSTQDIFNALHDLSNLSVLRRYFRDLKPGKCPIKDAYFTNHLAFPCLRPDCGQSFSTKLAWERHTHIKDPEALWICFEDGKLFTRGERLVEHLTDKHGMSHEVALGLRDRSKVYDGDKERNCGFCDAPPIRSWSGHYKIHICKHFRGKLPGGQKGKQHWRFTGSTVDAEESSHNPLPTQSNESSTRQDDHSGAWPAQSDASSQVSISDWSWVEAGQTIPAQPDRASPPIRPLPAPRFWYWDGLYNGKWLRIWVQDQADSQSILYMDDMGPSDPTSVHDAVAHADRYAGQYRSSAESPSNLDSFNKDMESISSEQGPIVASSSNNRRTICRTHGQNYMGSCHGCNPHFWQM